MHSVLNSKHDSQDDQHQHRAQQRHQLDILPPHLPLQPPTPDPELARAPAEPVRLVHQQIDPLPPLEQPLNIPRHDPPHVVDLLLRVTDGVVAGALLAGAVVDHARAQLGVEAGGAVVGQLGEVRRRLRELGEEGAADVEEVGEGYAPAEGGGGDGEEGETSRGRVGGVVAGGLGDVVDVVVAVGVGQLLRGGVVNLGEDERGEGGGLAGGRGGAFGEDGGVVGYAGAG